MSHDQSHSHIGHVASLPYNHAVLSPSWAYTSQGTSYLFYEYVTRELLTSSPLGLPLGLLSLADPGNSFILIHSYSWEAHEQCESLNLLFQVDPTLEEFSRKK